MAALLIYILTQAIKHGNAFFFNGMTKEGDVVEGRIHGKVEADVDSLASKIRNETFVLVQKYSLTNNENCTYLKLVAGSSKIFQTGSSFPLDAEKLQQFFHAPLCTVPEATSSPKKRRVSIQGTVAQVYDIKEGATWCRRDVYIEDAPTSKRICVKLWDTHANKINKTHETQKVTIENVEVDIYQDKRQLKSTDLTNVLIEEVDAVTTFSGEFKIMGADKEGEIYTLILEDEREIEIPPAIFEEVGLPFSEFLTKTPFVANIRVSSNKLTRLVLPSNI